MGSMSKDYAGATYNTELRYTIVDGENLASGERAQFFWHLEEMKRHLPLMKIPIILQRR